jgi:hypothetical protein
VRLSVLAPLALLVPLAACRFDFDPVRAMPGDAAPDAPPPVLPCGAPPQFSIPGPAAAVTLNALAATATDAGYDVLAVDSAGDVRGFSYAFDAGQLAARAANTPVFSGATGTVAAIDTGGGILAAIEYGRPSAAGTALVPLDAQLAPRGPPQMELAWYSLDSAIARTSDGALAFLGVQSNGAAAAKRVSPAGADLGASHLVIDGAEGVGAATITAAGPRFLVTWAAGAPSPNQVRAVLVDPQISAASPTTINPGAMFDGDNPRAGYTAAADLFLLAWSFKTSTGSDELWVSLRDGQLTERLAVRLSTHGVLPRVAAGKDDFLVAWKDGSTTSGIAAARVRFDGSFDPLVVSGSGGKALAWDLTARAGQPALVWIESAAAPGVWLDPLCN